MLYLKPNLFFKFMLPAPENGYQLWEWDGDWQSYGVNIFGPHVGRIRKSWTPLGDVNIFWTHLVGGRRGNFSHPI